MTYLQIITFSLLLGCVSPSTDKTSNETDYLNEISVIDTIAFDDLKIKAGNPIIKNYYLFNNQLYTGQAVKYEMANDGMWSYVYSFENGIMLRLDVYGINEYQHRFVEMKNGYEYHTVMFHRNGNRYLEQFYDKNKNPIGIWRRWNESGKLDSEKNFD